jgi:hypothetical protein
MMAKETTVKIGDTVKVKDDFIDPECGVDMSGWHGRIKEIFPKIGTALIAFDTITLLNLPPEHIEESEEKGLSWSEYGYDLVDLSKVDPRDTTADVEATLNQIANHYIFAHLGEEGREIRQVIQSVDPHGKMSEIEIWQIFLEQKLKFPLAAVVVEWQDRGPLRSGDKVQIHAIEAADEGYGLIVKLRRGRRQFHFPLCDLSTADNSSTAYKFIDLYRTWFANR